ncbi:MAG: hypothetical protein ACYTG4_08470 [Planctomycetota bacterium]|jgi:hypothetical protein
MNEPTVLLFVPDLFFQAKLEAAARHAEVKTLKARDLPSALAMMDEHRPVALVLDLGARDGAPALSILEHVAESPAESRPATLGFLPHVRADIAEKARAAGCGSVLAKSALAADTAAHLRSVMLENPPAGA